MTSPVITSSAVRRRLLQVEFDIKSAQNELAVAVLATPTGGHRELMTEANIHLQEALNKVTELL